MQSAGSMNYFRKRYKKYGTTRRYKRRLTTRKVNFPSYRQLKTFDGNKIGTLVETYQSVIYQSGGPDFPYFQLTGADYINITDLIQASATWTNLFGNFAYYRIREIKIEVFGKTLPADSGFVPGVIRMAFYPNQRSTDLATAPLYADDNFAFNCCNLNKQMFSIKIPKQFTAGPNSQGLNEWNAVNQIANLYGQFSICDYSFLANHGLLASTYDSAAEIKFMFIIDFCHTNT